MNSQKIIFKTLINLSGVFALAFFLLVPAVARADMRRYKGSPVTKARLIKVLKGKLLETKKINQTIYIHGVNFETTPEVERELRGAGARASVLAATRENFRASTAALKPSEQQAENDFEKGERLLEEATDEDVDEKVARRKLEEALAAFQSAAKKLPDAATYLKISECFSELENEDETLKAAKKAAQLEPDNYLTWENLAFVFEDDENYQEALNAYRKAIAAKPDYDWGWNSIGEIYIILGNYPEAVKAFEKAVAIDATEEDHNLRLIAAQARAKFYAQAVANLEKFAGANGLENVYLAPDEWKEIVAAYRAAKNNSRVLEVLRRAAVNHPSSAELRQMLAEAESSGAPAPNAASKDKALAELIALEKEWGDAYIRGDVSVIKRIFAEEFAGKSEDGRSFSKLQYTLWLKPHKYIVSQELTDVNLDLKGNTATLKGNIKVTFDAGTQRTFPFADTFVRRNGVWLVTSSEYSEIKIP